MSEGAPVGVFLVVDPEIKAGEGVSRVALDAVVCLGPELLFHAIVEPREFCSETKVSLSKNVCRIQVKFAKLIRVSACFIRKWSSLNARLI